MEFLERNSTLIIALTLMTEAALCFLIIKHYLRLRRETMYSYKNASFLGGSIFMASATVLSLFMLPGDYTGVNPALLFLTRVFDVAQVFTPLMLPLLLVFFLLMSISNISLIRHEGRRLRNILGSALGFLLIAATIGIFFGWDLVYENLIFPVYASGCQWITIVDNAVPLFMLNMLCYVECLLAGTIIYALKAARFRPSYDKDYIVILGCAISKEGKPLPLLAGRIDRAVEFAAEQYRATGKKVVFIPSGGKGSDECVSEAEAMKNYLTAKGIPETDIIMENKSVSTLENMRFSKALTEKGSKVAFATTNYHVFRAGIYARRVGLDAEGTGSRTKWYFWPNAFVREFVALVAGGKKGHLSNAVLLLLQSVISGCIYYMVFS